MSRRSTGTLDLDKSAGVNAVAGDLTVSGGTARWANAHQVADATRVIVTSGTLDLNGQAEIIGRLGVRGGQVVSVPASGLNLAKSSFYAFFLRDVTVEANFNITGATTGGIYFEAANNGTGTVTGNFNLGGAVRTVFVENGSASNDLVLSGVLSNGLLSKDGPGTLVLGGTAPNTTSGTVSVLNGTLVLAKSAGTNAVGGSVSVSSGATLRLDASEQIPNGSSVLLGSTAMFDLNGATETVRGVSGGGTVNVNGGTLVMIPNVDTVFSGNVQGTGSLRKQGFWDLTLSGTNAFTGSTYVEQESLNLTGNMTGSTITVAAAGTLRGTGAAGPVTVQADGALAPGIGSTGTGRLTVSSLTLEAGGKFRVQLLGTIDGQFDAVILAGGSGAVALDGALLVGSRLGGFQASFGKAFAIVNNPNGTQTGTFDAARENLPGAARSWGRWAPPAWHRQA